MTRRACLALCSFALGFGWVSLATTARAQTPAASGLDSAAVMRAADLYYVRTLEKAQVRKALDIDRSRLVGMRAVLAPLLEPAGTLRPETSGWSWSIHLETRDEPVAFCLPGGKILVSTGIFDRLSLSMPEFAAVLAHEIAHALAGEREREVIGEFLRRGETVSADPNRTTLTLAEILARAVASVPHDEASERAADALGLELMANAGVDPRPAVDAWHKIGRAGSEAPPAFPALHPTWANRIAELEERMPAMVALYEKTLRERPSPAPPPTKQQQRPKRLR